MPLDTVVNQLEESINIVIEMLKVEPRTIASAERLRIEALLMRLLTVIVAVESEPSRANEPHDRRGTANEG